MTVSIYGDKPAKCVLPHHEGLDKPPTLLIKILSKREVRAWGRRFEEAQQLEDTDARDVAYQALIGEVFVGTENPSGVKLEELDTMYTLPDYMILLRNIPMSMSLSADDLKK